MMCSLLDLLKDMASLDLYFVGFPLIFITDLSMYLLMEHYLSYTHHGRVYLKDQSLGHCPLPCTHHHWRILFMHIGLGRMICADDTQVYIVLDDDSDRALLIPKIERCVDDIKRWSTANDLKLNGDKTEVLHITSRFRNSSPLPCVQICNSSIEPVESAGNLGVVVQNDLKMDLFVNNICRSASFALYRIGQIRKFLDKKCTEMLVHAFITCRL